MNFMIVYIESQGKIIRCRQPYDACAHDDGTLLLASISHGVVKME